MPQDDLVLMMQPEPQDKGQEDDDLVTAFNLLRTENMELRAEIQASRAENKAIKAELSELKQL